MWQGVIGNAVGGMLGKGGNEKKNAGLEAYENRQMAGDSLWGMMTPT